MNLGEQNKINSCSLLSLSNLSSEKDIRQAKRNLEKEGWDQIQFFSFESYFDRWAGTPENRLDRLHKSFSSDVDCIRVLRGGSGVIHLLSKVDFSLLKKKPKFFVGYSDVTPLLNTIYERTGIIALHGPNAAKKLDSLSQNCLKNALQAKNYSVSFKKIINKSQKEISGIIKGGNLAMSAWSLGSSFEIDLKDKVVFFEDIGTDEYKSFNRLIQLKNSKKFKPKALVFGYMDTVKENVFLEMLKELFPMIPIVWGVKAGHQLPNYTLPIGTNCKIDFEKKLLHFIFPKSAKKYAIKF